ncbi:MAG TPA: glycerophosphodiester phosphodiesterase [Azospirillaceae bacterium]|nr:glycerophosphodiester phosphodiesterase [Azospirillaceae bacterium]
MLTIPHVIGHRGAKDFAPENTLASIREAARQGAAWVEVDVKLTRDGVPVLLHDDTLDRTTDGRGAVAETDLADLRRRDAGAWFGPDFKGERVPTLEECLDLVLSLGLGINLEIKPCRGRARETAEVALAIAGRIWPSDRPVPLVSSFSVEALETARQLRGDWPRGYLVDGLPRDWRDIADRLDAATVNINHRKESPASVREIRATGRPVLAYTVNDPARAVELLDWGVAGVFSDRPAEVLAEIRRLRR